MSCACSMLLLLSHPRLIRGEFRGGGFRLGFLFLFFFRLRSLFLTGLFLNQSLTSFFCDPLPNRFWIFLLLFFQFHFFLFLPFLFLNPFSFVVGFFKSGHLLVE